MKRLVVASLLVSNIVTVGCTSKEEKAYYEAQTKLLEQQAEMIESTQGVLDELMEQYPQQVEEIQDMEVPNLLALTKDDIINLYGKENITIEEGVYLEECPECSGKYTCKENDCWKYIHIN